MSPTCDSERMRFSEWMARALHDPERGYYSRRVRGVGRRGDFATSASAGTLLGRAIGEWLKRELAVQRGVGTVIEVGGGDGSLSAVVREALGWWTRRRLQWLMVETSEPLRAQQRQRIGANHARWFADITEALQTCDGSAIIFHNELIDALPVEVYRWSSTARLWQELHLMREGSTWSEVWHASDAAPSGSVSLDAAAWEGLPLRDGQRVEAGKGCRAWLHAWAPAWRQGTMLTIDYGDTFPQLYHRQPEGTVRAYAAQQRLIGPEVYGNMGHQDITADVNFTDLMAWGASLGWITAQFGTQREFLLQQMPNIGDSVRERSPADAFVLDEHGAGSAFKVLIQRRG